jgi:hypothetical protein
MAFHKKEISNATPLRNSLQKTHAGRRIDLLDQQLRLYRHAPGIVRVDAGGVEKSRELSVKNSQATGIYKTT